MSKTLGLLAALILASSCNEGDDMSLMDGSQVGKIGAPPIDLPPAATAALAPRGVGPLRRLISWQAQNQEQQIVTESPRVVTASIVAASINNTDGGSGPIIARIQWSTGNGGPSAAFVDVPVMSPNEVAASGGWGPDNSGSGTLISVPADNMQIDVFNNARLMPAPGTSPLGNPVPVTASAAIALGQRPGSARPSLTIWGYFDPPGPGLAAAGIVDIVPPPFAKSFTVFRNPANAFTVQQLAGSVYDGPIIVAAGAPSPRFDLLNNVALVRITNTGPAAVLVVGAVFEIGL